MQSYSFRDRPLDAALDAMRQLGLVRCELWSRHVEPEGPPPRDELRRWRETVPLARFERIRDDFARAGVAISAFNISFRDDFSDAEIERGFDFARTLGAPAITSSSNLRTVARIARLADKYKMPVGMHNHSNLDPNEFATPANLDDATKAGGHIAINLDIGHFTAANFDAVEFLSTRHARIISLHLKDRRRNQGPNVRFGEGDAPIGRVLRLLRDRQWAIPANIEYEYDGGDTVDEVRRCLEFCQRALES